MSVTGPDVIPCPDHPDLECVRIGSAAHGGHGMISPPDDNETDQPSGLCPDGYVPRRRRRPPYELDGKRIHR